MARDYVSTLVISKGHAFAHDDFLAMFDAMDDVEITLVQQPAAQVMLQPEHVADYDAVLFYDMSGFAGHGMRLDMPGGDGEPPAAYQSAMQQLLESGKGIVIMNHGLVSWPAWPLWKKVAGTSFLLTEGEIYGESLPGSGYRGGGHGPLPNAITKVTPLIEHPVLEGLGEGFWATDELYLKSPVFEQHVTPLMKSDFDFVQENFSPPPLAPADEQARWQHPPGSDVVVWANAVGTSPIIGTDLGDTPQSYADPSFRRLVRNALHWVSSEDGRTWGKANGKAL